MTLFSAHLITRMRTHRKYCWGGKRHTCAHVIILSRSCTSGLPDMAKRSNEGADVDELGDHPLPESSKKRKLAYSGAAKYLSKFKSEWCKHLPNKSRSK